MKIKITILLLAVASISFLCGAKVVKLKYPYLPAKWSDPDGITKLELACLKSEFKTTGEKAIAVKCTNRKPVPVILVNHIVLTATKKGIRIVADIHPFNRKTKPTASDLLAAESAILNYVTKRLPSKGGPRWQWPYSSQIRYNGKIVASRKLGGGVKTIFD